MAIGVTGKLTDCGINPNGCHRSCYLEGMAIPELDTTQSPLWRIRMPAMISLDDYRAHLARLIACLVPGERYALLLDLRDLKPLSGDRETRAGVAQALRDNIKFFENVIVCEARVIANPLVRAMATILDWTTPVPWPTKTVSRMEVAETWVRERLAQSGSAGGAAPLAHGPPPT